MNSLHIHQVCQDQFINRNTVEYQHQLKSFFNAVKGNYIELESQRRFFDILSNRIDEIDVENAHSQLAEQKEKSLFLQNEIENCGQQVNEKIKSVTQKYEKMMTMKRELKAQERQCDAIEKDLQNLEKKKTKDILHAAVLNKLFIEEIEKEKEEKEEKEENEKEEEKEEEEEEEKEEIVEEEEVEVEKVENETTAFSFNQFDCDSASNKTRSISILNENTLKFKQRSKFVVFQFNETNTIVVIEASSDTMKNRAQLLLDAFQRNTDSFELKKFAIEFSKMCTKKKYNAYS